MSFSCELCSFSTPLKANLRRHLSTKKHLKNVEYYDKKHSHEKKEYYDPLIHSKFTPNHSFIPSIHSNIPPNHSNIPPNHSNIPPNHSNIHPNYSEDFDTESKNLSCDKIKKYTCEYCDSTFTRKDNLNKHLRNRCHKKTNLEKKLEDMKNKYEEKIEKYERDQKLLYNHIDKLLEKVGDTNITQNIVLNCYGKEDLSHIPTSKWSSLLKLPYVMIPKMIQEVHFNKNCPQNNNICIPNKKEPYVKIFTDNRWHLADKKSTINDLIAKNFNRIDEYYKINANTILDDSQKKRYEEYMDSKDNDQGMKDVELVLINKKY
jgi:hypothetical protein